MGFKRLLVITDFQVAKSGIIERVFDLLKGWFSIELFDGVPSEPLSTDVDNKRDVFPSDFDALMHAVESFLARPYRLIPERPILYQGGNPFSRGVALEAFRLVWGSYRKTVLEGKDREAREKMSAGSHLAGLAFSHSGLGLVHALASRKP